MSSLESSWSLKEKIKNLSLSKELRIEVDKYILNNVKQRGIGSFVGICVRANLSYILDNSKNPLLLSQLKKLNKEI